MSVELIAILAIGATLGGLLVALASLFLVLFNNLREDLRGLETRLTEDIQDLEKRLTGNIQDLEKRRTEDMQAIETRFQGIEARLQGIETRLTNVEQELARQSGLIEGLFGTGHERKVAPA